MNLLGPYELNQIYAGDAKDLLAKLPEGCIDLTVTSPPYDDLRDYKGYTFDFEPIAAELFRVTKPGGVVVWVVGDATIKGSETGTSFRQALGFMELGFNLFDTIIYEVSGTGAKGSNIGYWQAFEYMFVFSKGKPSIVNLIRDRKNLQSISFSKGRNTNKQGQSVNPTIVSSQKSGRRTNVWKYNAGFTNKDDRTEHPAPFPEALARDHILSWSNPDDVVLDPLCGSGTTLKMAKQLNRKWLGFDISPEYVKLAQKRVSQAQPPLFVMG